MNDGLVRLYVAKALGPVGRRGRHRENTEAPAIGVVKDVVTKGSKPGHQPGPIFAEGGIDIDPIANRKKLDVAFQGCYCILTVSHRASSTIMSQYHQPLP